MGACACEPFDGTQNSRIPPEHPVRTRTRVQALLLNIGGTSAVEIPCGSASRTSQWPDGPPEPPEVCGGSAVETLVGLRRTPPAAARPAHSACGVRRPGRSRAAAGGRGGRRHEPPVPGRPRQLPAAAGAVRLLPDRRTPGAHQHRGPGRPPRPGAALGRRRLFCARPGVRLTFRGIPKAGAKSLLPPQPPLLSCVKV